MHSWLVKEQVFRVFHVEDLLGDCCHRRRPAGTAASLDISWERDESDSWMSLRCRGQREQLVTNYTNLHKPFCTPAGKRGYWSRTWSPCSFSVKCKRFSCHKGVLRCRSKRMAFRLVILVWKRVKLCSFSQIIWVFSQILFFKDLYILLNNLTSQHNVKSPILI